MEAKSQHIHETITIKLQMINDKNVNNKIKFENTTAASPPSAD